jgi:hypothetical protein
MIPELDQIELSEDGKCYLYNGEDFMRVTDVIHKVLPPYLAPWAEGVGHKAMYEVLSNYSGESWRQEVTLEVAKQEVRDRGLTCEDEKKEGGDRGSALHLAIEAMIRTGDIPAVSDFDNPEHAKYAQSFAEWMLDYQPVFEEAEVRIVHPELGYAGTFDAIGKVTARPKGARGDDLTGKRIVFDFKTNKQKAVYEQHLYQLCAYQLACERWGIEAEGAAVVSIGPPRDKGKPYTFRPNYMEPEAFRGVMDFYRLTELQKARNPLGRKK